MDSRRTRCEILPLDVEPGWGVVGNLLPLSSVKDTVKAERLFPVAHFIPGFTRGEGFFLAVLRKNGEEGVSDWGMSSDRYKSERVKSKKKRTVQASFRLCLLPAGHGCFMPIPLISFPTDRCGRLYVLHSPVR